MLRIVSPIICAFLSLTLLGQANIIQIPTAMNSDGSQPHPDAILDLQHAEKAFGLPVLTQTQRDLLNPALGMCIYNIDDHKVQAFTRTHPAGPVVVLDETYNPASGLGNVIYYNNNSWNKFDYGRTFSCSATGFLVSIDLPLRNLGGNACEVRVYDGPNTNGNLLATTSISPNNVGQWHSVTFPQVVTLNQGSNYTVVVIQECSPNMGTVLWYNALNPQTANVLENYDNSTIGQVDLCSSENWSSSNRDIPAIRVQINATSATFDWVNLH